MTAKDKPLNFKTKYATFKLLNHKTRITTTNNWINRDNLKNS